MMRGFLDANWRGLDVLAFTRKFGTIGIVVHHVSRTATAGCEDFLLDGWGDKVLRGSLRGFAREDISCPDVRRRSLERKRGPKKHMDVFSAYERLTSAAAAVGDISCHDDSVGYATRVRILNTEIVGSLRSARIGRTTSDER